MVQVTWEPGQEEKKNNRYGRGDTRSEKFLSD